MRGADRFRSEKENDVRATRQRAYSCGLAMVMLLFGVATAPAQAIRAGDNVAVTPRLDQRPLVEPHLAIHPTNPRHLLGAAIIGDPTNIRGERPYGQSCASFVSLDDGQTWDRHDFPLTHCFDPWVAITPDGHAVFTALAGHASLPHQSPSGLVVFHSADAGLTWDEDPIGLGSGHDHQTVVVDSTSTEHEGWLYIVSSRSIRADDGKRRYTVFVVRSRDGGQSFDPPTTIQPANLYIKAETPTVLSDGSLIVSFVDAAQINDGGDGFVLLKRRRAWVVRSTDGGHTFSKPMYVNEACGPEFRLSPLAADASTGPFRDRLYFACNLPGIAGVVLNYSKDGGEEWSEPVQVHSVAVDTTVTRKAMALAVNKDGVLGVAWVDDRNREPQRECYEVYFAASLDGGDSFVPEQRVSDSLSCPSTTANGSVAGAFGSGGDYFGMVTGPNGRFRLLWSDARDGPFQLWTTWVDVDGEVGERN